MDILLVDGLIDILDNEAEIYREVLKLSHNKTNVIVEGSAAELEKLTREEQVLIFQIADLEDVREKITAKLSAQCKEGSGKLTVSVLAGLLPQDRAQRLGAAQEKLSKTLKEIKEVNSLNSRLIRNSLDYIDFSINLLTGAEATGNLYGNSGQASSGRKRNFFDVRL